MLWSLLRDSPIVLWGRLHEPGSRIQPDLAARRVGVIEAADTLPRLSTNVQPMELPSDKVLKVRARPEHSEVRFPLYKKLLELGWVPGQLQAGGTVHGFPGDIAAFNEEMFGRWQQVLRISESKAPNRKEGRNQLEINLGREPRAAAKA